MALHPRDPTFPPAFVSGSPALPRASAIVLAGGRSSRFGSDKLDVWVAGQPLLQYTLVAVASVSREVLLVTAPEGSGLDRNPFAPIGGVPVRVVRDEEPFCGPLLGVLAGLRAASYPLCLIVGGDMPLLQPALLTRLLAIARADGRSPNRGVALRFDDIVQPLPMVLRRDAAPAVALIASAGDRALRDLLERLPFHVMEPEEWLPLDPEGASFVDIDRIEDLVRLTRAP